MNPEPGPGLRLDFFGGKGGVGKTTAAAAHAVASAGRGNRVLVVSTDPAHSLGDAFGVRLSSRAGAIHAGKGTSLFGLELDVRLTFRRWLRRHRSALGDAIERGTWLDRDDVDQLLQLPIPGIDELLALLAIVRIGAGGRYTRVVVDTAPTGHTLRLLSAPATVGAVSHLLELLQETHHVMRQRFARVDRADAADRLIAMLAHEAEATAALLRDPNCAAFHWVLLPEALSVAESRDGLAALRAAGMSIAALIVNRVAPPGAACPICDRRRAAERTLLARVVRGLGRGRQVIVIEEQPREPRGLPALERLTRTMRQVAPGLATAPRPVTRGMAMSSRRANGPSLTAAVGDAELIFVGGKGGVGKTTVAAALAVTLARRRAEERILLLSTDPAHSLGDVLATPVGDGPASIPGGPANLLVSQLNPAKALASRRQEIEEALREVIQGRDRGRAEHGVKELLDLAPPGLDELFGIVAIVEEREAYGRIVLDTAPTGHALRMLEMPDVARQWLQLLLRVLLKYRAVVRPGRAAEQLLAAARTVRLLREQLRDGARTRFVIVTRGAAVPRRETERLMRRLRMLDIAAPALVVNARTLAPGRCRRCQATDRTERDELARLTRSGAAVRGCVIIQTPLAAPPPRGLAAITRWAATWMS